MTDTPSRPASPRRQLAAVGLGWIVVAMLEAAAYTVLALAIARHASPGPVLGMAALALLATVLVTRSGFFAGARLAGGLYAALGDALARARLSWFTEAHRAQVTMLAGRGIPGFMSVPAHQVQTFLHAPLLPLFLAVGMGLLAGPRVALMAALLLALALLAQVLAQRALGRADAQRHAAEQASAQATLELVDHLELLRTAAGPARALDRLEQRWHRQEGSIARTTNSAAGASLVATLGSVLPLAGLALALTLEAPRDPALLLALLVLMARAAAPLEGLAVTALGINDLRAAIAEYRQATQAPALPEPADGEAVRPQGHRLTVQGLAQPPVLAGVAADIPEGARLAVTGSSGSGKSTLLGLLMRFDDPARGRILLGGVPLDRMRYTDLADRIAYVPQDAVVFTGTLAENIRMGRPQASDAEVARAARQAALGAVLDRSPLGIYQPVGHQGTALSGGERQRVAIARALLKDAPILVLDEATAALDETTEREIAAVVRTLPATVVFVTHRDPALWQPTQTLALGGDASTSAQGASA